jgi:hypothetical protein
MSVQDAKEASLSTSRNLQCDVGKLATCHPYDADRAMKQKVLGWETPWRSPGPPRSSKIIPDARMARLQDASRTKHVEFTNASF